MRFRSPGVNSATRVANSNCFGWPRVNGATKSSSMSWRPTASAISRRPWPAATQKRPAAPSRMRSPRSFHRYIPSARTTIFGSCLKSRLGVNGIQYSSSEIRRVAAWSRKLSSAWPIVSPPASWLAPGASGARDCGQILLFRFPELRDARRRPEGNQGARESRRPDAGVGPRTGGAWPHGDRRARRGGRHRTARRRVRGRRGEGRRRRGRRVRGGRHDREGQGAAARRVQAAARRTDPVHVPAPRPGPRAGEGAGRERRGLHRVRDGHVDARRPAAARADVGGGRPHVRAGRAPSCSRSRTAARDFCWAAYPASHRARS